MQMQPRPGASRGQSQWLQEVLDSIAWFSVERTRPGAGRKRGKRGRKAADQYRQSGKRTSPSVSHHRRRRHPPGISNFSARWLNTAATVGASSMTPPSSRHGGKIFRIEPVEVWLPVSRLVPHKRRCPGSVRSVVGTRPRLIVIDRRIDDLGRQAQCVEQGHADARATAGMRQRMLSPGARAVRRTAWRDRACEAPRSCTRPASIASSGSTRVCVRARMRAATAVLIEMLPEVARQVGKTAISRERMSWFMATASAVVRTEAHARRVIASGRPRTTAPGRVVVSGIGKMQEFAAINGSTLTSRTMCAIGISGSAVPDGRWTAVSKQVGRRRRRRGRAQCRSASGSAAN